MKLMKSCTKKEGYYKCVHMCTRGRELKNQSQDEWIDGWSQTNLVEYFLCIGSAKYTRASP